MVAPFVSPDESHIDLREMEYLVKVDGASFLVEGTIRVYRGGRAEWTDPLWVWRDRDGVLVEVLDPKADWKCKALADHEVDEK